MPQWTSRGLACLVAALATAPALAQEARDVRTVLAGTVMEKRVEAVLKGETVTVQAHEASPREMAVALACLIPPGRTASLARFQQGEPLVPEAHRDAWGAIALADPEGSLARLRLASAAEAKRYLHAKPGWDLGLSAEEISAFRALGPQPGQEEATVESELRRVLAARVRTYHEGGLSGIAPFARGGGKVSSLGEDLRRSTVASESFRRVLPATHRALLTYPLEPPSGGSSGYFWIRIGIQGRPVLLLTQRLAAQLDGSSVVIERRFYASWFLGAGQSIAALVPVAEGTLFFYVDHSFVDRWGGPGFATAGKRKIGLKLADESLREVVEQTGLCGPAG